MVIIKSMCIRFENFMRIFKTQIYVVLQYNVLQIDEIFTNNHFLTCPIQVFNLLNCSENYAVTHSRFQ